MKKAIGLKFQRWETTGTPAYEDIGELTNINGIGIEKAILDATHQGSADGFTEVITGLITAKPMSITVHLDFDLANTAQTNNHDKLYADSITNGMQKYRILLVAGGPNVVFTTAEITDLSFDTNLGEGVDATFTLTPSGKPVWASTPA